MARPFKKKIIEYRLPDGSCRLPDGSRVNKDTPRAVRHEKESPFYYGTVNGEQVKLAERMEASKRMLDKLRGDAAQSGVGLRGIKYRNRQLTEHLEDFKRELESKGNCTEHVAKTISQCEAVIEGCKWRVAGDVDGSDVLDFLADLRAAGDSPSLPDGLERFNVNQLAKLLEIKPQSVVRMENRGLLHGEGTRKERSYARSDVEGMLKHRSRGVSIETSNHYLQSIKAFSKWLTRKKRAPYDELIDLEALNAETDRRRVRRALPLADFDKFLTATVAGRSFRGLTGPARLVLYCVSARTGLRASELGSITPDSLNLDSSPPTITVEAAYSKHRREDVLPLRADTAQLLRDWSKELQPDQPLWPGTWPEAGAEMIRFDLEAAGIPYQDRQGRFLDFHGLRHTFLTHMASCGIHPKVAQLLARHSTITLTMDRYTHLEVLDLAGDLERLPALPTAPQQQEQKPEQRSA